MAQSLSDTTKKEYQRAFQLFNQDRDGVIEKSDLIKLMNRLNFYPKESEIDAMLGELPDGKSHQISYQDFLEIMAIRMFDGNVENELLQAFKVFDKEGRGVINVLNLREALADVNSELSRDEIAALIQGLVDDEGNIDYTKLIREFLFN